MRSRQRAAGTRRFASLAMDSRAAHRNSSFQSSRYLEDLQPGAASLTALAWASLSAEENFASCVTRGHMAAYARQIAQARIPQLQGPHESMSAGDPARKAHAPSDNTVGQVRGILADRVVVSTALDPFLSLRALASYACVSVRKLREHLDDAIHPLPHYRVGGKIVVRRSEFDAWMAAYRRVGQADVAGRTSRGSSIQ